MASVTTPWLTIVRRADPDRERELAREIQYEFSNNRKFYGDSRRSGVYSPKAPAFVVPPSITGTPAPGSVISCLVTKNMVIGAPDPTIAYQWSVAGVPMDGETLPQFAVQAVDVGETLTCEVTLTNASGSAVAFASVGPITARFDFELTDDTISDAADIGDLFGTFRPV